MNIAKSCENLDNDPESLDDAQLESIKLNQTEYHINWPIKQIYEENKIDDEYIKEQKITDLHLASLYGNKALVDAILKQGKTMIQAKDKKDGKQLIMLP